jgi:hypothetical protein
MPGEAWSMVSGLRRKLWAATAAASMLAVAGCGERESDAKDAGPDDDGGDALPDGFLVALLADGVAGAPCMKDADCEGDNAMCSLGAPDAVRSCTGFCKTDENCGAGGTCVETATFGARRLSFCQKVCSSDGDCSPELECRKGVDVNALGRQVSELLSGSADWVGSEETAEVCQGKAGAVQLEDGVVGSACSEATQAEDCGGGTCGIIPELMPAGYCTGTCFKDSHCGATGACVQDFASASFGLAGGCMLKCSADAECRLEEGYRCGRSPIFLGAGRYCVPEALLNGSAQGAQFLQP